MADAQPRAVLGFVEPSDLALPVDPQRNHALQCEEEDKPEPEGEDEVEGRTARLHRELREPVARRQVPRPAPAGQGRACRRRRQRRARRWRRPHRRCATASPAPKCRQRRPARRPVPMASAPGASSTMQPAVTATSPPSMPGKRLLRQQHALARPGDEIAAAGAGSRRQNGVGDDMGDVGRGLQRRPAVEADPADEQQQRAGGRQDRAVALEAHRLPLCIEAADARADDEAGGQRDPCAGAVHDGGTCEVDEACIGEEGTAVLAKGVAPGPVHEDRVDQPGDEDGTGDIGGERHPLGHCTRNDGRRRAAEHYLEDEKGKAPGIHTTEHEERRVVADPEAGSGTEGEHEADAGEDQNREGEVQEVLLGDVDRVLGPHHARFEQQEADLHQQHQSGGQQDPDEIQGAVQRSKARCILRRRGDGCRNKHDRGGKTDRSQMPNR